MIVDLIQKGVDSNSSILKNMGVFDLGRFSGLPGEFFHFCSVALAQILAGVAYNLYYPYKACYTELFGIAPRRGKKPNGLVKA